jgi:hypothetical protein
MVSHAGRKYALKILSWKQIGVHNHMMIESIKS